MRKYQGIAILAASALLFFSGCGGSADAPAGLEKTSFTVVTDDMGRQVKFDTKPKRIAVTSASFLEPLHEVDGFLVGRPDSKTKMPDYAKNVESIGQVYQIDMEKLLAVQPDVVIVNKGMNEKLLDPLKANGIPSVVLELRDYEDVIRGLRILAQLTGEQEKAESCIQTMEAKMKRIEAKLPKEKLRVAILHSTAQNLTVQLDGSTAGTIVKRFGWENLADGMKPLEKNPNAAAYSMETLVEQSPEILFVTSMGKIEDIKAGMGKLFAENPALRSIPAVKNGKVYYLSQELFLLSPGLHYPDAMEEMAKKVYPELSFEEGI